MPPVRLRPVRVTGGSGAAGGTDVSVCEACGGYARREDSPRKELRGRDCPKHGHVHRRCCAEETCSFEDAAGALRCGWDRLTEAERREHREEVGRAPGD